MSKLLRPRVSGNSSRHLTESLALRSTILVHSESGAATHVERRLFRLVTASAEPVRLLPTATRSRIPLRLVPDFLDRLHYLGEGGLLGVLSRQSGERAADRMPT